MSISPKKSFLYHLSRTMLSRSKTWFTRRENFPPFGFYEDINAFLKENKKIEHKIIFPEDKLLLSDKSVHYPKAFVLNIPEGRTWGYEATAITPDNKLVNNLCINDVPVSEHRIFSAYKIPEANFISGNSALIASLWPECYYHWLLEILPKLYLIEKSGYKIDQYIFNDIRLSFQKEFLELLKIPEDKIIIVNDNNHLKCENLIVTSLPGACGNCAKWAPDFYKQFIKNEKKENSPEKIYISRAKAKKRNIINEKELAELLIKKGFTTIYSEDLSINQQIELFYNAKIIVAPHGAGLSNLVFSQKNLKVIEIMQPDYLQSCFEVISAIIGCEYHKFFSEEYDKEKVNYEKDIFIDIAKFNAILEKVI